eukprot:5979533-Amphidinium_carterae.1
MGELLHGCFHSACSGYLPAQLSSCDLQKCGWIVIFGETQVYMRPPSLDNSVYAAARFQETADCRARDFPWFYAEQLKLMMSMSC